MPRPYTPRKREQSRRNGDKLVKQAITQTLQIIAGYLSALFSAGQRGVSARKGGVTATSRSNPGLSMDWQAWGTQGGLCWRATRDGLRHLPAGPPQSRFAEHFSAIGLRDTRQPAVYLRFPARTTILSDRQGSVGIPTSRKREIASQIENRLSVLPHLPGPEKTRLSPRADSSRGESWGCSLGLGFAQLIPTHQVTRGNQSRNSDC